jgi:hypothetical protein
MKFAAIFLAGLSLSLSARASVLTTVSCNVHAPGGALNATDPAACNVNGFYAVASANANALVTGPNAASPATPVSMNLWGGTYAYGLASGLGTGTALSSGTAALDLSTAGPVRAGFIFYSEAVFASSSLDDPNSSASANVSVGGLSLSCSGGYPTSCAGSLTGNDVGWTVLPFTLGQSFLFQEAFSSVSSDSQSAETAGGASASFQFILLDADGKTPVSVFTVAPEPQSPMLLMLGLGVLSLYCYCSARPSLANRLR